MKRVFYPKIRLAIDGNEANVINRVGSNVYAFEILKGIYKLTAKDSPTQPKFDITVLLASPPVKDLPKPRKNWRYQLVGPKPFWTQLALPYYLLTHKGQFDLFYTPGHYAPSLSPIPVVSSVMDLAFLRYPDQFKVSDQVKLKVWTAQAVKKAKKVITISQFSKLEVIRFYHKRRDDVVVAYPAVSPRPRINQTKRDRFFKEKGITRPYLLYLGTLQPRKNLVRLVKAYEKLFLLTAKKNPKKLEKLPDLVIAGKIGWLADEILETVKTSKRRSRIKLLGFVKEAEKHFLLSQAVASVQVGLYEGFGIPVLEAYQFGTPVVVSNGSSLPEAAGKAGIYVNPQSTTDIAEGLYQAVNLTHLQRQALKKLMQTHLKKFSWEKSAQVVLETLRAVSF